MVEVGYSTFKLASVNNLNKLACKTVVSCLIPGPGVIRTGGFAWSVRAR